MEKKINDIITKYRELRNTAWDNYRNVCSQEQKEIGDIMPNLNRSIAINEMDFNLDDFNEVKLEKETKS